MVDAPKQGEHAGNAQQGTGNQTSDPLVGAIPKTIDSACEAQPVKEKWWQQPEHIIQVFILIFVASYTVLTLCLWLTSKDTEHRQLRAYLIVKDARFEKLSDGHLKTSEMHADGQYELYVDYDLINEGQTPAYDISRNIDIVYPFPGPLTYRYRQTNLAYMTKEMGFGPVVSRHFSQQEIAEIEQGARPVGFVGKIIYHDIFGDEWPTDFCFVHGKWPQGIVFAFCSNGDSGPRLNYAR